MKLKVIEFRTICYELLIECESQEDYEEGEEGEDFEILQEIEKDTVEVYVESVKEVEE